MYNTKASTNGKTQKFTPINNEVEKKLVASAAKAYGKLYPDTLEVPLNRHFESDGLLVFVGVSFKYSIEKLYQILMDFKEPVSKQLSPKKDCFYIQGYCGKAFVNRYAFYSKKDKLTYIINYTFAANKRIELEEFKKIVAQTINK